MNITNVYNRFKACEALFRCPACSARMEFQNENSLVCSKAHCFDLSKRGYINFLPGGSKTKYTKELFESRRAVFRAGFYDPVRDCVDRLIKEYGNGQCLLDAGCGEGFFVPPTGGHTFGLDIFKEAVVLAAKGNSNAKWMVGDLSNIPLRTSSADILLNIFSPANYGEFLRVMKDDAIIIKAVPGEHYLTELREGGELKEYKNDPVLEYFHKNMRVLDEARLFYQSPVTERQLNQFVQMTPMMLNAGKSVEAAKITIDIEILVGRRL